MYERFEERYERSVGSFYLPVALWMVGGGPGFVGSNAPAHLIHKSTFEIEPLVGVDAVGDPETRYRMID